MSPERTVWTQHGAILLLPKTGKVTAHGARQAAGGDAVVCDLYVTGAEDGEPIPGGFRFDGIDNVDHHAPHPSMYRWVSSGNLAVDYIRAFGPAPENVPVLTNHCDCDSIVSSGIVRGVLTPDQELEDAVIAADHTGQQNPIADLLQPLQRKRDPQLSLECLRLLREGQPLPAQAEEARHGYLLDRESAIEFVERGGMEEVSPGFFMGRMEQRVDAGFFPALLPEAKLILVVIPRKTGWEMKIRLGRGAPEGMTLFDLDILSLDPNFGGRWNAGSNNRRKTSWDFTQIPPEKYAKALAQRLEHALAAAK